MTRSRPRGRVFGDVKVDGRGRPITDPRGVPLRDVVGFETPGKQSACWDLIFKVDEHRYFRRFARAGLAEAAKLELEAGFRAGSPFDPKSKAFVAEHSVPASPATRSARPTVCTEAIVYLRARWREWEPKTRREAARAAGRACRHLLRAGAPAPSPPDLAWLDRALTAPAPDAGVPARGRGGDRFWQEWSMPIAEVTAADFGALLARYRVNERDPARPVSAATQRRFAADLRQLWDHAAGRHQFPNPWAHVELPTAVASPAVGVSPVDPDLVLSPTAVWWLAAACAHFGTWGGGVAAYVQLMGLCGLRPGEAAGVRIEDLELPASGPGWITVRRAKRRIAARWLEPDDDPTWGPSKHDSGGGRRAPIPESLVAYLRDIHIPGHCDGPGDGLVCEHHGRPYDHDAFRDDVWNVACPAVLDKPLGLQPDDLRHSACAIWLHTPGVDPAVAQRWSGHRSLPVFLRIYQPVLTSHDDQAAAALDANLQ